MASNFVADLQGKAAVHALGHKAEDMLEPLLEKVDDSDNDSNYSSDESTQYSGDESTSSPVKVKPTAMEYLKSAAGEHQYNILGIRDIHSTMIRSGSHLPTRSPPRFSKSPSCSWDGFLGWRMRPLSFSRSICDGGCIRTKCTILCIQGIPDPKP